MSASTPLFESEIEQDEQIYDSSSLSGNIGSSNNNKSKGNARAPKPVEVLEPGSGGSASGNLGVAEMGGITGIFRSSSHPLSLLALYFFRSAAIATYVLCGLFTDNYVLSIVIVVVLLSLDFWNCRNVAGRTLVGLRYWNEVDEEGESSWVFESRDPSRPANPIDEKMFWIALYAYPLGWLALFFVSLFSFSISFLPIVILALVFNMSNVLGFTYADRDSKRRWANSALSSGLGGGLDILPFGLGGVGAQLVGGAVRSGLGRVFG